MYCLRVKILTLVTIGYIVGFIVGMYFEYCLWAQVAILDMYCIYWTVWDRYMQVLFLGTAPRTKETLPDFLKWRRVTRPPLVFRGLTGSQRTPGFWGVTCITFLTNNQFLIKIHKSLTYNSYTLFTCQKILKLDNSNIFYKMLLKATTRPSSYSQPRRSAIFSCT